MISVSHRTDVDEPILRGGFAMTPRQRALSGLRRALAGRLFLRGLIVGVIALGFVWGTAVLVLRVAWGVPRLPLLWGAACLAPLAGAAWIVARRRCPSIDALRATLDYTSDAGGLYMAEAEGDLGGWDTDAPAPALPAVHWRDRRMGALCLASLVFVAVAFAAPNRYVDTIRHRRRLAIDKEVQTMAQRIETLEKHRLLPKPRTETLREQLDRVEKTASGTKPARTWEALDHLEESVQREAKDAAQKLASRAEPLARAETLSEALKRHGGAMSPEKKTRAMKDLAQLARQAAGGPDNDLGDLDNREGQPEPNDALNPDALPEDLRQALEQQGNEANPNLDPEQLERLRQWARQCRQGDLDALRDMRQLGMIDPEALKPAEGFDEFDPEEILRMVEGQGQPAMPGEELPEGILGLGNMAIPLPGRGGVSRGPGAAPLRHTHDADPDGTAFKERALPPAALSNLKNSLRLGTSKGAPKPTTDGYTYTTGALTGAQSDDGSTRTHTILPKHREAVERFFERGE
jgi:hypothetical protein